MSEEINKGTKVKELDFSKNSFEANGKTYTIEWNPLSVGRFPHFEDLCNQATFGTDFIGVNEGFKKIFNTVTTGSESLKALREVGDIALNFCGSIVKRTEQKSNYCLLLSTLFMNTTNEDRRRWDMALANEKIKDWEEEGIAANSFFLFVINIVPGLRLNLEGSWAQVLQENVDRDEVIAKMKAEESM